MIDVDEIATNPYSRLSVYIFILNVGCNLLGPLLQSRWLGSVREPLLQASYLTMQLLLSKRYSCVSRDCPSMSLAGRDLTLCPNPSLMGRRPRRRIFSILETDVALSTLLLPLLLRLPLISIRTRLPLTPLSLTVLTMFMLPSSPPSPLPTPTSLLRPT